jgi:hypothetical protein
VAVEYAPSKYRFRQKGTDMKALPIAVALACASIVTARMAAAVDPVIQCRDIRETKLKIEKDPSGNIFYLSADTRRFIDEQFGTYAGAVFVNIDRVAAYVNSNPEAIQRFNRFAIIGDITGTSGPIFLISPMCGTLCKSIEIQRSAGSFSSVQIEISPNYLSIAYPAEDLWTFKTILETDRGLLSLEYTLNTNVAGETSRFRGYLPFVQNGAFVGRECRDSSS